MMAAALPTLAPQAVGPTQGSLEPSRDGGPAVAVDELGKLAFGQRLKQCIAGSTGDADPALADAGQDATVESALPTDVIICGAALPAPSDAPLPKAAKDDANALDAGADLAAQLALVSQWVALAQAPAAGASQAAKLPSPVVATTSDKPAVDVLGVADKLATLRGAVRPEGASDAQVAPIGTAPLGEAIARLVKGAAHEPATKADAATHETDRSAAAIASAATVTPTLATTLAAIGPLKDVVERTVAPLDATPMTSTASLAATLLHAATGADANQTPAAATAALREPVGTTAWTEEFGRAAVHVATTGLKEASIRLNPEHLGPLDVRVRIDDGVAHLNFQAAHVDTRHALEASRPMLDLLFSNQGLSIGDYSVDDHSSGSTTRDASTGTDASTGHASGERRSSGQASTRDDPLERVVAARLAKPLGLVDTFA